MNNDGEFWAVALRCSTVDVLEAGRVTGSSALARIIMFHDRTATSKGEGLARCGHRERALDIYEVGSCAREQPETKVPR